MRKILGFLRGVYPFLLSHHPDCDRFNQHTINVHGLKLCAGCATIYPSVLISLCLLYTINFFHPLFFKYLFFIGLLLIGPKIISILLHTGRKTVKIGVNILVGIGIAICIFSIFSLPFPFVTNLFIFIVFFMIVSSANFLRVKSIMKTCLTCEYHRNWSVCPGFKGLYNSIEKNLNEKVDSNLVSK